MDSKPNCLRHLGDKILFCELIADEEAVTCLVSCTKQSQQDYHCDNVVISQETIYNRRKRIRINRWDKQQKIIIILFGI